jgi:tetratricopeptide (TPR) repeat protein
MVENDTKENILKTIGYIIIRKADDFQKKGDYIRAILEFQKLDNDLNLNADGYLKYEIFNSAEYAVACHIRGCSMKHLKEYDEILAEYYLSYKPNSWPGNLIELSRKYLEKGDVEKIDKNITVINDFETDDENIEIKKTKLLLQIGELYNSFNQQLKEIEVYNEIIEYFDNSIDTLEEYYDQIDDFREEIERIKDLNYEHFGRQTLGDMDFKEILEYRSKIKDLNDEINDILYSGEMEDIFFRFHLQRGKAYFDLGEYSSALYDIILALKVDPNNNKAKEVKSKIEQHLKNA